MSVKPLHTLLAQADALLGRSSSADLSKVASEVSEASALARMLSGADADVTFDVDTESLRKKRSTRSLKA